MENPSKISFNFWSSITCKYPSSFWKTYSASVLTVSHRIPCLHQNQCSNIKWLKCLFFYMMLIIQKWNPPKLMIAAQQEMCSKKMPSEIMLIYTKRYYFWLVHLWKTKCRENSKWNHFSVLWHTYYSCIVFSSPNSYIIRL